MIYRELSHGGGSHDIRRLSHENSLLPPRYASSRAKLKVLIALEKLLGTRLGLPVVAKFRHCCLGDVFC